MNIYFAAVLLLFFIKDVNSLDEEFTCKKKTANVRTECWWNEDRLDALQAELRELRILFDNHENPNSGLTTSHPSDCQALFESGHKKDGVYRIYPDNNCPFEVHCDMTNGGWTIIQRRQDGQVNFTKPWDSYVFGFGDLDGEFWLGLDKIHRLTKGGVRLKIQFEDYAGKLLQGQYKSFTVDDSTSRFTLRVDQKNYEGTLPELLSYHDKMMFSTYDNDNDASSGNCAASHQGGGMWFKSCYTLHPNGPYNRRAHGGLAYYQGGHQYMKNSILKIKRREALCK